MVKMHGAGVRFVLPVVVAPATPLEFRRWSPGCRMEHGVWRIPQPAERHLLIPTLAIAPLVGYDPACYRLGYGGGFFDRTLASLNPRALAVGIGYPELALPTIFPRTSTCPWTGSSWAGTRRSHGRGRWALAEDRMRNSRPRSC
jgi:5,10-methenyltetrahydrofolate synthetase